MCNQLSPVLSKKLESVRVNIAMPVVRTDGQRADGRAAGGRAVYGHVITKFSAMGRFTYPWCSAGALRAPELRYYIAKQRESCLACQPLLAAVCNSSDVCPSVFHKIKKVNELSLKT